VSFPKEHRTDAVTLHIALIAATAAVPFNGTMTAEDLRLAFVAEVKRQFGPPRRTHGRGDGGGGLPAPGDQLDQALMDALGICPF
jgi:hypothetical protein